MLKAALRRTIRTGVLARVLLAHVSVLRALGRLPKARKKTSTTIRRIFFSFPYHSVGDLILSLTLLDRVHDLWPEACIDVAVGASMAAIVEAIPYVHHTFRLKRSSVGQSAFAAYAEIYDATQLFQEEIVGIDYDLALAPRWDSADSVFSAYLAYLTGAPIRCGYSGSCDGGSPGVDRFYTNVAAGGVNEHESLRYTRLLSRCGLEPAGRLDPAAPEDPIRSLKIIAERRRSQKNRTHAPLAGKYAVFSPGATNRRRKWPIARFAETGRALYGQFGLNTVVIGGAADIELCQELSDAIGEGSRSLAGKTDSLQMLDLITDAELFLGNDSGPAHMAGGLGVSTIVISPFPFSCELDHPNSPRRFRPVGPRVRVLQPSMPIAPCSPMCRMDVPHCILQITTENILESIRAAVLDVRAVVA